MIVTTTDTIQGKTIKSYLGIVNGITVTGFGAVREFLSGFTDTLGGRSGSYEKEYRDAKEIVLNNLKKEALRLSADAVVSIKLDYENISSKGGSFIMVTATGTAVKLEDVFEDDRKNTKEI
ncbi:MAG: hypothetical protein AUJ70_01490 [Candidatus Omnitrophica bacterium CG1_02_40_15]|nr:MAG: hypothetical protein AUJ70_01490 [Candidatus Omnitrophica bacterium CG1_02_40_15]